MKKLQDLPQVTEKVLHELTADETLKNKILDASAKDSNEVKHFSPLRLVPVVCSVAAAAAVLLVFGNTYKQFTTNPNVITTTAIQMETAAENADDQLLITGFAAGSRASQESIGQQQLTSLDLSNNSAILTNAKSKSIGIWAKSQNGYFPLVRVKGCYYRLLTSPSQWSSSLKGSACGSVEEFTDDPALSESDAILSNVLPVGTELYYISGTGTTLLTAEAEGIPCLFQRVSFNGKARNGKESFEDISVSAAQVSSLDLSKVGEVTDAAKAQQLFSLLLDNAAYDSSSNLSSSQTLLVKLKNGLSLQFLVKGDKLCSCGTWSCPEFFEAFELAVQ